MSVGSSAELGEHCLLGFLMCLWEPACWPEARRSRMAWAEINEMNEISPSGNALTFPSISLETVSLANASPMRPESLWEGAKERFGYRGHQCR